MNTKKTADYKLLVRCLKRCIKAGYNEVMLVNNMMVYCYDPETDDDIGMHYILHVPTENCDLYDSRVVINCSELLAVATEFDTEMTKIRKEKKMKPSEYHVDCSYLCIDEGVQIAFIFKLTGEVTRMSSYHAKKHDEKAIALSANINKAFHKLAKIKRYDTDGKDIIQLDVLNSDFFDDILEIPRVIYKKVKVNGTSVKIPFIKSFLHGFKKFDQYLVTVSETVIPDVYIYTQGFTVDGIMEEFLSYIVNM